MNHTLLDYYRCPDHFASFTLSGNLSEDSGYFRFGSDTICYGQSSSGSRVELPANGLYNALADVTIEPSRLKLPFNPSQIVENLRRERYVSNSHAEGRRLPFIHKLRKAYYFARPLLPVSARKHLQRIYFSDRGKIPFPNWPLDRTVEQLHERLLALSMKAWSVDTIPFIWFWPDGWPSCAIMTHDVEGLAGRDFCSQLMDINDLAGIKSSFQIVPEERYPVTKNFLQDIRARGFETNVHDLNHDGRLFSNREKFLHHVERINRYAREFEAIGFRSGALYRNADWYYALDFSYDMSIPNVGHLEPQRGGCCTVMPFFVENTLEIPLTTTQDYSLFHVLGTYSIDLWKQQIALITEKHGLISFIIHPDYIIETRARDTYKALLDYLGRLRSDGEVWIALPGEVNRWWRERSQMKLTRRGDTWQIEGPGKERARIAYATLEDGHIRYHLEDAPRGKDKTR